MNWLSRRDDRAVDFRSEDAKFESHRRRNIFFGFRLFLFLLFFLSFAKSVIIFTQILSLTYRTKSYINFIKVEFHHFKCVRLSGIEVMLALHTLEAMGSNPGCSPELFCVLVVTGGERVRGDL